MGEVGPRDDRISPRVIFQDLQRKENLHRQSRTRPTMNPLPDSIPASRHSAGRSTASLALAPSWRLLSARDRLRTARCWRRPPSGL